MPVFGVLLSDGEGGFGEVVAEMHVHGVVTKSFFENLVPDFEGEGLEEGAGGCGGCGGRGESLAGGGGSEDAGSGWGKGWKWRFLVPFWKRKGKLLVNPFGECVGHFVAPFET